MGNGLEDKVEGAIKKYDSYYATKEVIVGAGCDLAAMSLSAFVTPNYTDSKEYVSAIVTGSGILGYFLGYACCVWYDRKNYFKRNSKLKTGWNYIKYLLKSVTFVGLPSGIVSNATKAASIYSFQGVGLHPEFAALASFIPATLAFIGCARFLGHATGFVKKDNKN